MFSCIILVELYDRYMYVVEEEVKILIELVRNKCMNYLYLDVFLMFKLFVIVFICVYILIYIRCL